MALGWGAYMYTRTALPRPTCPARWALAGLFLILGMLLLLSPATTALAAGPGTLVDAGFETGTDGATLASPPWTLSGAPQRGEYDTAAPRSAPVRLDPGRRAAANAGVVETAPAAMTANGAEIRFWLYFDTTNQNRDSSRTTRPGVATPTAPSSSSSPPTARSTSTPTGRQPQRLHHRRLHPGGHLHRPAGPSTASSTTSRTPDLHALQARERHRRLDAAQGRRRHRLRHPVARRTTITTHGTCCAAAIRARTCGSTSWPTPTAASSDTRRPPPPPPLAADTPAPGAAIALSWAAATDTVAVTGYNVYRGTAPASTAHRRAR